jgi:hypothetical protein
MKIKKLSAMPYAQAHVELTEENRIALFSYVTLVAEIVDGWLYVYGLYSQTTRKHIGAFCKEYANCTYQTAKSLYEKGYRMNIHTGEVVEIENH